MPFKEMFFPSKAPQEHQLVGSRRTVIIEHAIANSIFSLGVGNFLAGYLTLLGASPAFCAIIAAMPQLGCVLQLVSPFMFERLRWRKLSIVLLCFGFRLSLGLSAFVPLLFRSANLKLGSIFAIYCVAFLFAGFVTPGLTQWMQTIAPTTSRGQFFALRDIVGTVVNAAIVFSLGFMLDHFIRQNQAMAGYLLVFGAILLLTAFDFVLMCRIKEIPAKSTMRLKPADLLGPLKNKEYRPIIVFTSLWFLASGFSQAFLPVYQLQALHLSHSYLSAMVVVSSVTGILSTWLWGRLADRAGWGRVMLLGGVFVCAAYLGWFLLPIQLAYYITPVLLSLAGAGRIASGMSSANLQYANSPSVGKTAYFGVTDAVSNTVGYLAALFSASIQRRLEAVLGLQSIAWLFLGSAVFILISLVYGWRRMPGTRVKKQG